MTTSLQQTIHHDAGFVVRLPADWAARLDESPDSLSEVARYAPPEGERMCVVFHHDRVGTTMSADAIADATEDVLADGGYVRLARGRGRVAGRDGVILEAARTTRDATGDKPWHMRYHVVRVDDGVWVLGLGTRHPTEDSTMLEEIAASFGTMDASASEAQRASDRFARNVTRLTARARQLAVGLGHPHVGTEHLLLAMLADETCAAARILALHDAPGDRLREIASAFPARGWNGPPPLSPRAEQILAAAAHDVATTVGHAPTRSDHILMAILSDPDATATRMLTVHGIDAEQLRGSIRSHWERLATR